jgi:hypothetical protein
MSACLRYNSMRAVWRYMVLWAMLVSVKDARGADTATFYKDIQPIIYRNCTGCHRAGQSGPFELVSYKDMLKHAATIKYVISVGYMPPWEADTGYRKFTDERHLSKGEISTITSWIENGAPAGKEEDATCFPFINQQSNLGKPDLVLTAPEVFKVPGINQDTFAYFVMHYTLPSDTNVLAFEFSPGDPRAVHHSNTWVFPETSEYDRFYAKTGPEIVPAPILLADNFNVYEMLLATVGITNQPRAGEFRYPDFFPKVSPLYYDGWVPGASARTWPEGFGFRLPNKGLVIMQIHYGPTPVDREDQSSINIFFTDKRISRMIESYNIGSGGGIAEPEPALVLPPDSVKSFEITTEVTREQSYLALNPHMHYLGKEMKAFAITPTRDTIPLIWIKHWDFKWQEFYKPLSLIRIPKGSLIKIFATFDNTRENPENRSSPPKQVVSGSSSSDEMMSLIVMSVNYELGDERIKLNSDVKEVGSERVKKR